WSGDTAPFPEAIAAVKRAGLLNINGGDSRMDNEYPSYLTVAPFGFVDGGFRQIHTSGANENLYTDGWQTNFSGFRHVLKTLANTESPRRASAANIYYHIYSGEREASLRAVKDTLDAVSRMELTPIATTTYVEMAEGFYSARFEKLSEFSWRVHDRGALSTLRFDDAENLNVDYTRSEGVLGARHVDDVLYVSLDRAHAAPLVALRRGAAAGTNLAILESARWEIWGLAQADESLSFNARGFGPGQMSWRTAPNQAWHVEARYSDETKSIDARSDADGLLHFVLPRGAETAIEINMAHVADGAP
ncbi:MAG: polysaccharide deacetylase family protein, partial [Alphaproteobacteria bacterium]